MGGIMSRIVVIDEATQRPGINELGDVIEIQEDGWVFSPAYGTFKIIDAPGFTKAETESIFASKRYEKNQIYKTTAKKDEWSFTEPEMKLVWKDGADWKEVIKKPYRLNNLNLSELGRTALANDKIDKFTRQAVLEKATDPISRYPENSTVIPVSVVAIK